MVTALAVMVLTVAALAPAVAVGQEGLRFRQPTIAVEVTLWSDFIDLADTAAGPQGELRSHQRPSKRQSLSPLNQIKAVVEQALLINPIRRQEGSPLGSANQPAYTLQIDLEQEGASALGGLRLTLRLVSDQVDVTFEDRVILDQDSVFADGERSGKEVLLSIQDGHGDLLADYVCQYLKREWLDGTRLLLAIWEKVILADAVLVQGSATSTEGFLCAFPFTYQDIWVTWPTTFQVSFLLDRPFRYTFTCEDAALTAASSRHPAFDGGILAFSDPGNERDLVFGALERLAGSGEVLLQKGAELDLGDGRSAPVRGVGVRFQEPAEGQPGLRWNTRRRVIPPSEVGTG